MKFFAQGLFLAVVLCAGCPVAEAAESAKKCLTRGEEWCPVSAGPLVTWGAPIVARRALEVQPFFYYNRTRGIFNDEGNYKSFTDGERRSQVQEFLFMRYGITDFFEIDGQGVYQQNYAHREGRSAYSDGFGDTYIFARYCMLEDKRWVPHVTGLFQLKMPTGKYQKANPDKLGSDLMGATSGGGSYEHGYGVNFSKKIKPLILHADLIWSFPVKTTVDGVKTLYADNFSYNAAAEWFLPLGLNLMLEINGFLQEDRKEDGIFVPSSDVKYTILSSGLGWSCDKVQTLLAYSRVIAGVNTDAYDSIVFTFIYTF